MNKFVVSFALVAVVAVLNVEAASLERTKRQLPGGISLIPREFQNLNIENYLKNPRAVAFQLKCVIYDGPCDRIGKYLKSNFPIWLQTQCKNCSPQQKQQAIKAITHFQKNYPKEWNDGVKKYRGTFTDEDVQRFEDELGIKVQLEVPVDASGKTPKPDTSGLVELAREAIAAAKTTKEPLILETRTSSTTAASTSSTGAPATA